MKSRKTKKIGIGFLIGIFLTLATLFTLFFVFMYLVFFGGPARITQNIDDYKTIFTQPSIQTGYITFPEEIPEGALNTEFYSYCRDTFNTPTVQTYLQCTYDETTYKQEINRLENTSKTYGNRKMELLRDEENKFNYPVYIAIDNAAHSYEYALLTGKNEITYIYTSYIDRDKIEFNENYLPCDFMTEEGREFGSGYSIYYASVSPYSIDTDFTRNPSPEVTDSHMKVIDDNMFIVYVKLDEKGREIITGCTYFIYSSPIQLKEEIEYHDIDGMQYKDMRLNQERTIITVVYLDGEEEKEISYNISNY